jgi:hypothetical protein
VRSSCSCSLLKRIDSTTLCGLQPNKSSVGVVPSILCTVPFNPLCTALTWVSHLMSSHPPFMAAKELRIVRLNRSHCPFALGVATAFNVLHTIFSAKRSKRSWSECTSSISNYSHRNSKNIYDVFQGPDYVLYLRTSYRFTNCKFCESVNNYPRPPSPLVSLFSQHNTTSMDGPSDRDSNPADLAVVVGRVFLFLPPPYRQPLKDMHTHPWPGGGSFLGKNPPPSVRFEPTSATSEHCLRQPLPFRKDEIWQHQYQ